MSQEVYSSDNIEHLNLALQKVKVMRRTNLPGSGRNTRLLMRIYPQSIGAHNLSHEEQTVLQRFLKNSWQQKPIWLTYEFPGNRINREARERANREARERSLREQEAIRAAERNINMWQRQRRMNVLGARSPNATRTETDAARNQRLLREREAREQVFAEIMSEEQQRYEDQRRQRLERANAAARARREHTNGARARLQQDRDRIGALRPQQRSGQTTPVNTRTPQQPPKSPSPRPSPPRSPPTKPKKKLTNRMRSLGKKFGNLFKRK